MEGGRGGKLEMRNTLSNPKRRMGFTLVELLLVLGLMGLLLALGSSFFGLQPPDEKSFWKESFLQFCDRARLEGLARQRTVAVAFDVTPETERTPKIYIAAKNEAGDWELIDSKNLPDGVKFNKSASKKEKSAPEGELALFSLPEGGFWAYWAYDGEAKSLQAGGVIAFERQGQLQLFRVAAEGGVESL